jgi:hypothetical protein
VKRCLVLLTAASVALVPLTADAAKPPAKKKTTRTLTFDYAATSGTNKIPIDYAGCIQGAASTCVEVTPASYETLISVSVVDKSGQTVGVRARVGNTTAAVGCGKSEVAVVKGDVFSFGAVFDQACPGPVTQGIITMTITGYR